MSSPPPNATLTTYRNPVLPGWNAHPSVCNVPGKGYFVATSSAALVPAVPVYHSTDLFTWELVGHAIHDTPGGHRGLDYWSEGSGSNSNSSDTCVSSGQTSSSGNGTDDSPNGTAGSTSTGGSRAPTRSRNYDTAQGGYWTPALRYHGGRWYVVVVHECEDGEPRLLLTSTRDIFDTTSWSQPVLLAPRGRDPELFFDPARSFLSYSAELVPESEPKVYVCPIDLESGTTSQPTLLYRGPHTGTRLLKCAGWYYLFVDSDGSASNGNTPDGSRDPGVLDGCTNMYRTKTHPASGGFLEGYESAPHNPVLYNSDHQEVRGTSRLSLVRGERGWSAIFHGTRGERDAKEFTPLPFGHETYMASAAWVDGWPVINSGNPIGVYGDAEGMRWLPEVTEFEDPFEIDRSYAWSTSGASVSVSDKLVLRPHYGDGALYLRQPSLALDFSADLDVTSLGDNTAGVIVRVGDNWARVGVRRGEVVHQVSGSESKSFPFNADTASLTITCRPGGYALAAGDDVLRVEFPAGETGIGALIGLFSTGEARFLRAGWKRVD